MIKETFTSIETLMARFDLSLVQLLEDFHVSVSQSLGKVVSDISSIAISGITSTVSWVPRLFFGIVLSIISSVFIALDYGTIMEFLSNLVPARRRELVEEVKVLLGHIG